jgi:hypothetical protein
MALLLDRVFPVGTQASEGAAGPLELGQLAELPGMASGWVMENQLLAIIAASVAALVIVALVLKRRHHSKPLPEMPPVFRRPKLYFSRAAKKETSRAGMMSLLQEMERAVDSVNPATFRERERKWYNGVKLKLGEMKRSMEKGDIEGARRSLNDAELFLKMLELNAANE